MSCTGAWADVNNYSTFWNLDFDPDQESQVNQMLQMSASTIHAAMAANGACDCSLASWTEQYLIMLNVVLAAVMFVNECVPTFSDQQRELYMNWVNEQVEQIRDGRLELCAGATGSEFPAFSWAEHGFTEFNRGRIIMNDLLRKSK